MDVLPVLRVIAAFLYGGLTLLAAVVAIRMKKKPLWPFIAMTAASVVLMYFGAAYGRLETGTDVYISHVCVIASLLAIEMAAVRNGRAQGKINYSHHMIRFGVSIIVLLLFLFS